jgi:hypothetical protein
MTTTVTIDRDDLLILLAAAFDMWNMAASEWSSYPDEDDVKFLEDMANLAQDPGCQQQAAELRAQLDAELARKRQTLAQRRQQCVDALMLVDEKLQSLGDTP